MSKLDINKFNILLDEGFIDINDIITASINIKHKYLLLVICLYKNDIINYHKYKSMLQRLYFQDTKCWYFGELMINERKGNLYHCSITDCYYDKFETSYDLLDDYIDLLRYKDKSINILELNNAIKLISNKRDITVKYIVIDVLFNIIKDRFEYSEQLHVLKEILLNLTIDSNAFNNLIGEKQYCEYCGNYYNNTTSNELISIFETYFYIKE